MSVARFGRTRTGAALAVALLAGLATTATSRVAQAAPERWPSWPSEVDRVAAPLTSTAKPPSDRERGVAVLKLQRYPTELITDALLIALQDPSVQVRREALRACYVRRIDACVLPATEMYVATSTPTLQAAALRVLANDPTGERLDLLLDALRDPSDPLRAEAAQLAGWAAVSGEAKLRVRRALLAKLSDAASVVRQQAVAALGLQGPGTGTLAIARLLEDPEPTVRTAAATALGQLRDPRAVGALRRAIEGQNEGNVVRAMVEAMARLPAPDAARALLEYLDDPPQGVGPLTIAEAMGDRPDPEAELIDGLLERMREPAMEAACVAALLWIGEPAAPALTRARDRGLDPALDQEVTRLLDAVRPTDDGAPQPFALSPNAPPQVWARRLQEASTGERLTAGLALAQARPPWFARYAKATIAGSHAPDPVRGWLMALADSAREDMPQEDTLGASAKMIGWASSPETAVSDRCLSMLAAATASRSDDAQAYVRDGLSRLSGDANPRVRACVAVAAGRAQDLTLAKRFLLDTDPVVRAAAALALRTAGELPPAVSRRLQLLHRTDPSAHVRAAASPTDASSRLRIVTQPAPSAAWVPPTVWLDASGHPLLGSRGLRWSVSATAPGFER